MSAVREIKRRIKSASNIGQVTRALEMVSAVKMKKAQAASLSGQPYADYLKSALLTLTGDQELAHPFLTQPQSTNRLLVIVVGPQKGLAGSLISNLGRKLWNFKHDHPVQLTGVSFGKKGRDLLVKQGIHLDADFGSQKNQVLSEQISALTAYIDSRFRSGQFDVVYVIYSRFVNTMVQKPEVLQLLPAISLKGDSDNSLTQFTFEPSRGQLLDMLLEHYMQSTLRQIIFDSSAAEHSARMVAMKNANENAADIVKELGLTYNKIRQSAVTSEIADIISGSLSN